MSNPQETRKWFLNLGGQRKGPLNLKDIYSLLEKGAISPATPLISNEPGARPTTVQTLLQTFRTAPHSGPQLTYEDLAEGDGRSEIDPVTDLFNTLQAAKERNTRAVQRPIHVVSDPSVAKLGSSVLRIRWLSFVLLGGAALAFGVMHLLRGVEQSIDTPPAQEHTDAPKPRSFPKAPVATPVAQPTPAPRVTPAPTVRPAPQVRSVDRPLVTHPKNTSRPEDAHDSRDYDRIDRERNRDEELIDRDRPRVRPASEETSEERLDMIPPIDDEEKDPGGLTPEHQVE